MDREDEETNALLYAASLGRTVIAKLLISAGANPHYVPRDGETALICASHDGHVAIVDMLLAQGVDVNHAAPPGLSALHFACLVGHIDAVHKLLEVGRVDVNHVTFDRDSALICACRNGYNGIVNTLLAWGANVNHQGREQRSALMHAVWRLRGHVETTRIQLAAGADVHATDHFNNSILHKAAEHDNRAIIEMLLEYGADVNKVND